MPSIQEWFNLYAGIRDNVGGLKAALEGAQSALNNIQTRLANLQGDQITNLTGDLDVVRADLSAIRDRLKGTGDLTDLSLANQITKLAHWVEHSIAPNLAAIADEFNTPDATFSERINLRLQEIAQTSISPDTPLNKAMSALELAMTELTVEGSPSILDSLREVVLSIHGKDANLRDWLKASTAQSSESAIGEIANKGQRFIQDKLQAAVDTIRPALSILLAPFNAVLNTALNEYTKTFESRKPASPANARSLVTSAIESAYKFGQTAHFIAVAAEMFQPLKQLGFPQLAAALGDLAGFKEISGTLSRSLIGASMTRPLRWWGNDTFSPEILPVRDLIELVEKREIGVGHFARVLFQHGYDHDDVDLLTKAVWREPSIRDLALSIEDATVDEAWLFRRVQRAGYEDADAERLTAALGQRAIKSTRAALIGAARATVTDGILDADSYRAILGSLSLRPDVIAMEIRTAELNARRDYVNAAIATYKRQYNNDVISRSDCALALTALGVTQDRVELILLDADASRAPKIAQDEAAQGREAIREIQRELVPRYRRLYELGVVSDETYQDILESAGISPGVAAVAVILDRQKRQIITQKATATAFEREVASLVSETERALRLQFEKGLIDAEHLEASLLDLGISPDRARVIVQQERARLAPPPGRVIEAPDEAKDRILRDLALQTALNDFRRGRLEVVDLFDELIRLGMDEDEAIARVNLEISRLQGTPSSIGA